MSRTRQKIKNLILHVEQIKGKEFFHEFEENPQVFPIIVEMIKNRQCEFLKPFSIRLKAFSVREIIEVQGTLKTRARLSCSRCLKNFDTPLASDFELSYTKEIPGLMDVFDEVMRVNSRGFVLCTRHAVPAMIESGGGSSRVVMGGYLWFPGDHRQRHQQFRPAPVSRKANPLEHS